MGLGIAHQVPKVEFKCLSTKQNSEPLGTKERCTVHEIEFSKFLGNSEIANDI